MADAYVIERGCYAGVHEVSGLPLAFMAEANVGGRVMVANNEPVHVKERVQDFDGVSLYPSAMSRMPGFLIGAPIVWDSSVDLESVDGYFVKILVKSVGRTHRFPQVRIKLETSNNWTCDIVGEELTVDKVTLEEMKLHMEITYDIICGYYFDQGRDPKIKEVITKLFNDRLEYKAKNNPVQLVLKNLMNSAYGIGGMKPILIDTKYIAGEEKDNFIENHYNNIRCFTEIRVAQTDQ
jgi:hypothetical protein